LVQYVLSRAIVDDIGHGLDLRRIYASPSADRWARLRLPVSIEELVAYWQNRVDAYYEPADATVVIQVRAFTPADSLQVARAVVAACQRLVNQLSLQMRQDALQQAAHEVADTQARLASTMADIRDFREREGLINPNQTAQASTQLAARLDEDLVQSRAKLSTLRAYMSDGSPAVSVLKARIRSLEAQRRTLVHPTTGPDPSASEALARAVGSFETLETRNKFAEDAYSHALAGLDRARAEADRQQVYIASFIPPTLAEEPLYPRRWRMLGVVALIAFAVWAIGGLSVQSIRDHI
jgi:capsular polysaccharide transport system permease protein